MNSALVGFPFLVLIEYPKTLLIVSAWVLFHVISIACLIALSILVSVVLNFSPNNGYNFFVIDDKRADS